jgi:hypothetical protein
MRVDEITIWSDAEEKSPSVSNTMSQNVPVPANESELTEHLQELIAFVNDHPEVLSDEGQRPALLRLSKLIEQILADQER